MIGAGIVSGEGDSVPIPSRCSGLTLTDSRTNVLKKCVDNLRAASFPPKLVQVGNLDFHKKVSESLVNQFDFVLGNDCAQSNQMVEGFANTCALLLKDGKEMQRSFLHIGPEYRESNGALKSVLSQKGLVTKKMNLVLERLILAPIVLENMKDIGRQPMRGGAASYETKDSIKYNLLALELGQPKGTSAQSTYKPVTTTVASSGPAMNTYANSLSGDTVQKYTPPTPKTPVNPMGGYLGNIASAKPFSYTVPVSTATTLPSSTMPSRPSYNTPAPFAAAAASKKALFDDHEALRAIELACEQKVEKDFLNYCEKLEKSCNASTEAKIESINFDLL